MASGLKKHKSVKPMPVTSSFSPPNRQTCHSECVTRLMTPQEYTDMINKYGPPTAPLSARKSSFVSPPKKQQGGGRRNARI